jgi:hypothetical protein
MRFAALFVVPATFGASLGSARSSLRRVSVHSFGSRARMGLLDVFRPAPSADAAVYNSVVDAAPSWDALREMSASAGGAKLRDKWAAEAAGRGAASHQTNLRLFDAPDGTEPTVELFRDTAGWCPYARPPRARAPAALDGRARRPESPVPAAPSAPTRPIPPPLSATAKRSGRSSRRSRSRTA